MTAADDAMAETLLSSLRTIAPPERRKHAMVYNYWLSIRGDREFPPIRDLDPLEISDAGPFSLLLEMIGGGEDAEIRHIGQAIKNGVEVEKIGEAPNPSLLSCIAPRLPVVAGCRDAFSFEDEFETAEGKTRCWVTLLPFSATGTWIDFVYGFVSLSDGAAAEVEAPEITEEVEQAPNLEELIEAIEEIVEPDPDPATEIAEPQPIAEAAEADPELGSEPEAAPPRSSAGKAGFSAKFFETLANVGGFYGKPVGIELDPETASVEVGEMSEMAPAPEPVPEAVAAAQPQEPEITPPTQSPSTSEDILQSKLTDVRAKADEARQAKLRANAALYEGLSAAYDFALDAEETPEEYLRLVEAEGLKIQLRSPMKPVAKLAFDGMCDDATIKQLEAILDWAFAEELPRGTLAERIEAEGGIAPILSRAA
jgi:hypothetical protein